ncbi:MAG: hypothetical protein CMI67_24535 [Pelagibaca sp.]|nr:hypothetical protein [Pelagibaca sp.]
MQTRYNPKAPKGQVSDNLEAALDLAAKGIPVLPWHWVARGTKQEKVPRITDWPNKATTDARQIERWFDKWPDAQVGFVTGERSGIDVVDLDQKHGKDGVAACEAAGITVDSPVVIETSTGGLHHWCAHVPGQCSAQDLLDGVDVRANRGWAAAPGSDGYRFISGDADLWADLQSFGCAPQWPEGLEPQTRPEGATFEPVGIPFQILSEAVLSIPINVREKLYGSEGAWFAAIRALHDETGGSEEGRELAHKFSEGWGGYSFEETEDKWSRPNTHTGAKASVMGLIRAAQRNGWCSEAFDAWQIADDFDDLPMPEEEAEIADRSGGLTFLSPSDCSATPARSYIIKGLLAQGDVAAIVGAPGAGKSLFAPRLGYAVAQGAEVFGRRVKAGGVFYVAAEDGHGMQGRVTALRAEHGDAPDFAVIPNASDLLSKQGQLKALQRAVKERRPALIVIDTLAVAFPGLEENDAKGMGQVVAAARSLTKWGAAVVLIHHDTKAGDGLPRGHSLLNGALDVALYLKREDGGVSVKPSKNRNGTTEQELAFTVGVREIGTDEDGDAITAAICEEADNASRACGPQLTASARAALSVLRDLGRGTMHVPEESWRDACIGGREVSASDNADSRRKAFKRAVESLTREGVVIFADGKFAERHRDNEQFTEDFDDV